LVGPATILTSTGSLPRGGVMGYATRLGKKPAALQLLAAGPTAILLGKCY